MNENCVTGIIAGETLTHYRVSVDSEGDCKSCGMSNVCSSKTIDIEKISMVEELKVGQKIRIEYKKVIQTSFIVYILPILFFFAGIGLTKLILNNDNELILFVNAVLGAGISLLLVSYINRHHGNSTYKLNVKLMNQR